MNNWFVLYVQAGREFLVSEYLNIAYDYEEEDTISFVPQIERIFKNSKVVKKELKPMFSGYVFIETTVAKEVFINSIMKKIRFSDSLYKLLEMENIECSAIKRNEQEYLINLCNDEYVIEESVGFFEGDSIQVTSGPLKGKESTIKKIDRHKRRAEVELDFMGDLRRVTVALEIVKKV